MPVARASSAVKRAHVISVARALFIERGYDRTTVQDIAEHAKAALGSVTYLAGSKPAIAAEIHEALVSELTTNVRLAIAAGPLANSAWRIIEACHRWLEEDASRLSLIDDLDQALAREGADGHRRLGARLAATLHQYGQRATAQTGGLGGAELHALLLAPLIEVMRVRGQLGKPSPSKRRRWIDCLAAAAVGGLEQAAARPTTRSRQNEAGDLFPG